MDGIGLDGWFLSKVIGSLSAPSVLINKHTLPHTPPFVIVASAWVRGNRGCVFFWVLFFPSPRQPRVLDTNHLMPFTHEGFNNIYIRAEYETGHFCQSQQLLRWNNRSHTFSYSSSLWVASVLVLQKRGPTRRHMWPNTTIRGGR